MLRTTRQPAYRTRAAALAAGLALACGWNAGVHADHHAEAPAKQLSDQHSPATIPDRTEPLPQALQGVETVEQLGAQVPAELVFTNEAGETVKLGDYFTGDKPMVLQLAYFRCPVLCSLVTKGLAESVNGLSWTPGEEFEVITVSIDPKDTPLSATKKKTESLNMLDDPAAAGAGWHFLTTADTGAIARLTQAVGCGYQYLEEIDQYSHQAVLIVLTPEGKVSRYLYGDRYPQREMRLSMVEAADGKVGSAFDKALLFCFQYDPIQGKYAATAFTIMRGSGLLMLVLITGTLLYAFLIWEVRRRREAKLLATQNALPTSGAAT